MTTKKSPMPSGDASAFCQLCSLVGNQRVADLLGIAKSTVSEIRTANACRPAFELAAKYELAKRTKIKPDRRMIFFVKVPCDKREVFEAFVRGMGFQMRTFVDDEEEA